MQQRRIADPITFTFLPKVSDDARDGKVKK